VRLRFDDGSAISEVASSRGLGCKDGVAETDGPLGHAVEFDKARSWDQLAERERFRVCCCEELSVASAFEARARVRVAWSTWIHLQRCGTMLCFGFPAIGGQLIRADPNLQSQLLNFDKLQNVPCFSTSSGVMP
jgi:hypothetical protein